MNAVWTAEPRCWELRYMSGEADRRQVGSATWDLDLVDEIAMKLPIALRKHYHRFVDTHESLYFGVVFKAFYNLRYRRRYGTGIRPDSEGRMFIPAKIAGRAGRVYLARPKSARMFRKGLAKRQHQFALDYALDMIPVENGDVVLDIGANIGELGLHYRNAGISVRYVFVEPERRELEACGLNNPGQTPVAGVLWKEEGDFEFHHNPHKADSSMIQASMHHSKSVVPAFTLESLLRNLSIGSVKLLKLEAEGAEPEVLEGAEAALPDIQYITADLGPERGHAQECTVEAVTNFLLQRGFDLLRVNFPGRLCCLYKNRNAP